MLELLTLNDRVWANMQPSHITVSGFMYLEQRRLCRFTELLLTFYYMR